MDYSALEPYVSRLPKTTGEEQLLMAERPFLQSIDYKEIPHPIRPVVRQRLEFSGTSSTPNKRPWTHTASLWSCVSLLMDETYSLAPPSLQRNHTQYVIQALKQFLTEKTMYQFLTGRRVYPLLELLDKPRVDFEKKHHHALGHFLSFLWNKKVIIDGEPFQWSSRLVDVGEDENAVAVLQRNEQGFWNRGAKRSPPA